MTREPGLFRHPVIPAGGGFEAGFRLVEIGRDSEETQQRSNRQIVHIRGVQNLALDLIGPRANRLLMGPVEEQFLVGPRPSAELFPERGKPMLRDQDQGARDAERVGPTIRFVEIC